jgi:hypothetical protein
MKILKIWGIPIKYHDALKEMSALNEDDKQRRMMIDLELLEPKGRYRTFI